MVTGNQIATARELQIKQRPLAEIANRLHVSPPELDKALWRAAGIRSENLRTFWADAQFS